MTTDRVKVVKVPGMKGYRFDAVGIENLPLAIELARIQAVIFRKGSLTAAEEKLWNGVVK
jgi:hypothetical protein